MQTIGEMLEIRDEFEAENEKTELGVLVDVIDEQLDYFNQDKDFDKEVADAVQEIEITPEHPCPIVRKYANQKAVSLVICDPSIRSLRQMMATALQLFRKRL